VSDHPSIFRQNHDLMSDAIQPDSHHDKTNPTRREPIPGEREADTLVDTQPGAVSGVGFGATVPRVDADALIDEETSHELELDGGGAPSQRPHERHPDRRKERG